MLSGGISAAIPGDMGIVPSLRSVLSIPPLTPEPLIPGHTGKGETVASNTGVPMLRPGTQAAPEAGPAAEPTVAGDTSSWLVDPETLVTVVRQIPPGSDFHRLARFLEVFPPE